MNENTNGLLWQYFPKETNVHRGVGQRISHDVPHEHEQVSWRSVEDMTQMALAPIDFKFVQTLE